MGLQYRPSNLIFGQVAACAPSHFGLDAVALHISTVDATRSRHRATRMHQAWDLLREKAQSGAVLEWELLRSAQSIVLGHEANFRQGTAFAKGGAEEYFFSPRLENMFIERLPLANEVRRPPVTAAVVLYLDVCFFHPFEDGNGRLGRLALAFVALRAGLQVVSFDFVRPISAGDLADYRNFARQVSRCLASK